MQNQAAEIRLRAERKAGQMLAEIERSDGGRPAKNDIFAYDALFDRADFNDLSPLARQAFGILETTDFEIVMRALRDAGRLLAAYAPSQPELAERMRDDATGLREVLVRAIAHNHPAWPGEIGEIGDDQYSACRRFLSHFAKLYTLNYDLLLYCEHARRWPMPTPSCIPTSKRPSGRRSDRHL